MTTAIDSNRSAGTKGSLLDHRYWPFLIGLIGIIVAFYPSLATGLRQLQINIGDPRLVQYILEHSWLWISGNEIHSSFWSPPVFYPEPNIGAFSDTLVGGAWLYWPWRALGVPAGQSYILWMMGCLSLAYSFFFLFLRRGLGFGAFAASAGAFLYGFGSTRLGNFNSPQLFPVFYPALALWAASIALHVGASRKKQRAAIVVFFAALALQAWSTFYPAFFAVFLIGIAALVALLFKEPRTRLLGLLRREWPLTIAAAVVAALSVWPMARAHLAVADLVGWRTYSVVEAGLPSWASWIFMGRTNWLYGGLASLESFSFATPQSQHSNGVGLLTLVLALIGLWQNRKRPAAMVVGTTLVVAVLLATRWGSFSVWQPIYDHLPGAGAIRFVARMGMYLPIAAGLGLAAFIDTNLRKLPLALVIFGLCAGEQLHRLSARNHVQYVALVERIAALVEPERKAFVITTQDRRPLKERGDPFPRYRVTHVLAMWVEAESGVPTINGFYGNRTPEWRIGQADLTRQVERVGFRKHLKHWMDLHGLEEQDVQRIDIPYDWVPWLRDRPDRVTEDGVTPDLPSQD